MPDIKIMVCCHQISTVPKNDLLLPVQVGAALVETRFPGFAYDDAGENISAQNRSYCELTALYWAWKNLEADWYGLFHYRRYLYPDAAERRPYRIEAEPSEALLEKLGYEGFSGLIEQYDLIAPKGENMHFPVRQHYADAPFHHKKDLDLVEEIIRQQHRDYVPAMEEYLSGTVCYFGNIAVMKRPVFHDYCKWLFSILEEFDRRADLTDYGAQELRVNGYLAERLLGVYYTHRKEELNTLEIPRVHFVPDYAERRKKQFLNGLLPPGSKRRAFMKKLGK